MVTYQTTVQQSNTIRFGSAKVEIGTAVGTLVDVGAAANVEFTEESTPIIFKPDNAPEIQAGVKDHTATVKFDMWELKMANLNLIRGGIDVLTPIAASEVTVTDEPHTLTGIGTERLNYKMGDGSVVSTIVVTDATANAAVINVDYVIGVDPDGYTTIARVAGSTVIDTGEGVLVDYKYTPNASVKFTSGGLNTVAARVVRLTNTNGAGKKFQITVFAAKNQGGLSFSYPADDAEEPMTPTIEMRGILDPTLGAGAQLFEIIDEQGV